MVRRSVPSSPRRTRCRRPSPPTDWCARSTACHPSSAAPRGATDRDTSPQECREFPSRYPRTLPGTRRRPSKRGTARTQRDVDVGPTAHFGFHHRLLTLVTQRSDSGALGTMTMPSAYPPPSPLTQQSPRDTREGLQAGSGWVAGVVGGAVGGFIAVKVGETHSVLTADPNVTYCAIFGSYGAVLGGALLATDSARGTIQAIIGRFAGGALVGGAAGGLGSLVL